MNKVDFLNTIQKGLMSKCRAEDMFALLVGNVKRALKAGENVRIAGLGTLTVVDLKPRRFRNPQTGETVEKPASKRIRFKEAKGAKE